jgi:hypothetical protein
VRAPPGAQRPPGRGAERLTRANGLVDDPTSPIPLAAARYRRDQARRGADLRRALELASAWATAGLDGDVELATAAVNVAHVARAAERIALAGEVQRGRSA